MPPATREHEKAFALAAMRSLQARIDALIDPDTQQKTRIAFDLFGPYEVLLPLSRCERVRRATPGWLTPEHHGRVQEKYREARQRSRDEGVDFHVDHIVPIQGARVCGLHVPWNLEVIPAAENMAKKNRFSQITGLG